MCARRAPCARGAPAARRTGERVDLADALAVRVERDPVRGVNERVALRRGRLRLLGSEPLRQRRRLQAAQVAEEAGDQEAGDVARRGLGLAAAQLVPEVLQPAVVAVAQRVHRPGAEQRVRGEEHDAEERALHQVLDSVSAGHGARAEARVARHSGGARHGGGARRGAQRTREGVSRWTDCGSGRLACGPLRCVAHTGRVYTLPKLETRNAAPPPHAA